MVYSDSCVVLPLVGTLARYALPALRSIATCGNQPRLGAASELSVVMWPLSVSIETTLMPLLSTLKPIRVPLLSTASASGVVPSSAADVDRAPVSLSSVYTLSLPPVIVGEPVT